jgi:hypothetical protein
VVKIWTPTRVVCGSNPSQNSCLFHAATVLIFYITQTIALPKLGIFRKSITVHHFMDLLQVALMSVPPHKFVHP